MELKISLVLLRVNVGGLVLDLENLGCKFGILQLHAPFLNPKLMPAGGII